MYNVKKVFVKSFAPSGSTIVLYSIIVLSLHQVLTSNTVPLQCVLLKHRMTRKLYHTSPLR